jgi:hypothetical protein
MPRNSHTAASSSLLVASRTAQVEARASGLRWAEVLGPLKGYGVWMVAVFLICAASAAVRLDVQQLHRELDRTHRAQREARMQNERLSLELAVRNRAAELEGAAGASGLGAQVVVVHVDGGS